MIEAMEPPTSLDVIERYGLEMLAAMRDGEQSNPMLKLIHGWRFNAPTLQFLFDRLFAVRRRHDELRATQGEMALSARLSPGTNRPILFATVSPGYFQLGGRDRGARTRGDHICRHGRASAGRTAADVPRRHRRQPGRLG